MSGDDDGAGPIGSGRSGGPWADGRSGRAVVPGSASGDDAAAPTGSDASRDDDGAAPIGSGRGAGAARGGRRGGAHSAAGRAAAARHSDAEDEPAEEGGSRNPTLLDQMGGVPGIISSAVPAVVFVVVQAIFATLLASIIAAVVAAVGVAVWRLVRGEALQPALTGLFGVAVCAFIAYRTGQAKGFFLLGIWTSLLYGGVFLVSVLARWPLVGVIWHGINGDGQGWRRHLAARRGYDLASLAWVLVFGARFVVQHWLYGSAYADAWLGWVRIAMGVPLAAVAALVTIWAIRRSQQLTAAARPA